MANRQAMANRAITRIKRRSTARSEKIAQFMVEYIAVNGPYDQDRPKSHLGQHLKFSYYARVDTDGSVVLATRRRYWAFVEYGTRRSKAQPHVRPAIDAAKAKFRL